MTRSGIGRLVRTILALSTIALLFTLAACGEKAEETKDTASSNLSTAESALTTMAPDARLLVVGGDVTPASGTAPVWTYLFGAPDTGLMYSVSISNGNSMGATDLGTSPLTEDEWDAVPANGSWELDSDAALEKALAFAGLEEPPATYSMLLNSYIPEASVSERPTEAMVWYVSFGADDSGEAGRVVAVDATTGEASFAD